MEYKMEDFLYGMEMEWKKIARMKYRKIIFHFIPHHALATTTFPSIGKNKHLKMFYSCKNWYFYSTTMFQVW